MRTLSTLLSFGNRKLPKSTAIFNLGTAEKCPSAKLGLCKLCNVCYAKKAERLYPQVTPYREAQSLYWLTVTADYFVLDFLKATAKKKNKIQAIRFNESGDFYSQNCVDKMEEIARQLKKFGIVCYVYTARKDLIFSHCVNLQVIGSNFMANCSFIGVKNAVETAKTDRLNGIKASVCCGDCKKCRLCQIADKMIIYCEIH